MGAVLRMVDHAPVPCGAEDLADWAREWIASIETGSYGKPRSLIIVMEAEDGHLAMVSQSSSPLDQARVVGLLTILAHRRIDGGAKMVEDD